MTSNFRKQAMALLTPQRLVAPLAATGVLWFTSPNQISLIQVLSALLLLLLTCWSYWYWRDTGGDGLPLFSAAALMYWVYFALQLFWGDRRAMDWRHPRIVTDAAITQSLLMVVAGVISLWLGARSPLGRSLALKRFPELLSKPFVVHYLQAVAILGTLLSRYESVVGATEGTRQIVVILESTVSLTAAVILLRRALEGKATKNEKLVLLGIIGVRVIFGVSSGWIGSAIALAMVCGLVYLKGRRKLPVVALACVLPYMLFFQAGKNEFRRVFWYGDAQADTIEKIQFWVDASLRSWQVALEDSSGARVSSLLSVSLARTSLLTQAANVLEQTPSAIPYQYGRMYSYLPVALVPRFLWPDKPSVIDANQFYQVAYGVTPERELNHISIAVGVLVEGYINFGWFGVMLVMFLIGVLLEFWNVSFLSKNSTLLATGVGIALLPQLLAVESQLAQYLSGVVQHVLVTVVVFLPVTRLRGRVAPVTQARGSRPQVLPRERAAQVWGGARPTALERPPN